MRKDGGFHRGVKMKIRLGIRARARIRSLVVMGMMSVLAAPALADGLQPEVDQAVAMLEAFRSQEDRIPDDVLEKAYGLVFLTVVKGAIGVGGEIGKGIVIARKKDGKVWSGPSGVGTGGASFGFQWGGQVNEIILVLNTPKAVTAFTHGNVSLGGEISAAAGPLGRNASAGVMPAAAIYSYSRSQGVFGGISLKGAAFTVRDGANEEYYGKPTTPKEILNRRVTPPAGADKLRSTLESLAGSAPASSGSDT